MNYGLKPADILLPKKDFEKFAVIACDQYTSEPQYWENAENARKGAASALDLILPEIYLEDNADERIAKINRNMEEYLQNGVFEEYKGAMIYLERTLANGSVRKGLVGLIDLEDYDYTKGSHALIRATEATVLERIPPRVKIRSGAALELPHVMLFVDDPQFTVIEPLSANAADFRLAYDFDLMCGAGHAKGRFIDERSVKQVSDALYSLVKDSDDKLLFAVGDGNHSLATAKECYRQNKTEKSRYALVEIVNIHDESIVFEPIYRVLFGANANDVLAYLKANAPANGKTQRFECIYDGKEETIELGALGALPVGTLQKLLDAYIAENPQVKIDYIHGVESVKQLCKQSGTLGFIFEGMKKSELFGAVKNDGSLPRKTFSMGTADDKRFYIEARRLK